MHRRTFLANALLVASTLALGGRAFATTMTRRTIPSSGESLGVVGFGTWQTFDVDPDDDDAMARLGTVLDVLFEHGGSMIDASPMYGRAETVVGDLLASRDRDDAFLATKVWTRGREAGVRQMEASVRRMAHGTTIDLMQVHNLVDWRTHLETLRAMKDDGRIRYVGLTHYTDSGARSVLDVIESVDGIDFVQCAYSLGQRTVADALLPACAERGIAFIANRPFAGGGAFGATRGHEVPDWARDELGVETWAQFFLKFVLGDPRVICVIPGTGKVHHARDNVRAGFGPMPDAGQRRRMIAVWDGMR